MKSIIKPLFTLSVAAAFGLCASCAQHGEKEKQDPALLAKAKVSQAQAEKTALTKAPDGTVKESELKNKHGKGRLVWSVEIARPKTADITEVKVDAITGRIVQVEVESPDKDKDKDKGKGEKGEKED